MIKKFENYVGSSLVGAPKGVRLSFEFLSRKMGNDKPLPKSRIDQKNEKKLTRFSKRGI